MLSQPSPYFPAMMYNLPGRYKIIGVANLIKLSLSIKIKRFESSFRILMEQLALSTILS
jgi:hypothetical protein